MVFPHRRCHYGTLVPFERVLIWYFLTVPVTMVLSCHLGGCGYGISSPYRCHYGTLMPLGRVLIWYFLTVDVTMVLLCHWGGCWYGTSLLFISR
jgi:hypothetical protein